jgi:carboxypeptidase Q
MLARIAAAGDVPVVRLKMEAHVLPNALSHNVVGQVTGRELPNEIVVVGGHLDSWDVGQGAHDDGGGCIISMEAVRLLMELGIRPRRTVRAVLWTNEENGTAGADEYRRLAVERGEIHAAAVESDGGVEPPTGFGLTIRHRGSDDAVDEPRQRAALAHLLQFALWFAPFGADSLRDGGGGADIAPLMRDGVPGLALRTPMELYWDIHHTHADTVDKVDPEALRKNVAAMAVMAYLLAEMPGRL